MPRNAVSIQAAAHGHAKRRREQPEWEDFVKIVKRLSWLFALTAIFALGAAPPPARADDTI